MEPVDDSETANMGQQYNLKWTNHTNNILLMFTEQLSKEYLVDVTLSCEGQFIKAHKMVLSACSPYFQELFEKHTGPHPVIIINGVRFASMKHILAFMYQGEIKISHADLEGLLILAETFQVKGLCKIRLDKQQSCSSTSDDPGDAKSDDGSNGRKRRRISSPAPSDGSSSEKLNGEEPMQQKILDEQMPHILPHFLALPMVDAIDKEKPKPVVSRKISMKTPRIIQAKQLQRLYLTPAPNVFQVDDTKTVDKDGIKIPRPPNAFMIFANEWRKKLAAEYPGESNKEISVRLGNMWKSLSTADKDMFYLAAKKADEEHKVKYPGYYYSPKEARLRKELKTNQANPQRKIVVSTTGSITTNMNANIYSNVSSNLNMSGVKPAETIHLVKLLMPEPKHAEDDGNVQGIIDVTSADDDVDFIEEIKQESEVFDVDGNTICYEEPPPEN